MIKRMNAWRQTGVEFHRTEETKTLSGVLRKSLPRLRPALPGPVVKFMAFRADESRLFPVGLGEVTTQLQAWAVGLAASRRHFGTMRDSVPPLLRVDASKDLRPSFTGLSHPSSRWR